MDLRSTFQSVIALHQKEFPVVLKGREKELPLSSGRIVTVTGIRRCGKSSMLLLTANRLLASGVDRSQILYIGFDDERFAGMKSSDLDEILQAYREMFPSRPLSEVYMFFDEIQLIEGWELFVLRVYKSYCKNIFITGSTAKMLSDEMASALRGWPDEYRAFPLDFSEFCSFRGIDSNPFTEEGAAVLADAFRTYCHEGGFPEVVLASTATQRTKILQSYFSTMMFRDMMEHYHIKASSSAVRYFLKRVMSNLTKPTSVNNVYNELKSQGVKVSKDSLYQWLDCACNVYLFRNLPKYTRSLVKQAMSPSKYYMTDIGLRNAVLLSQSEDEGKALENYVYSMLDRSLGEEDQLFYFNEGQECDFVVVRRGKVDELVQACWALDEDNVKREVGGLLAASAFTGCQNLRIVTFNQQRTYTEEGKTIKVVPAWKWS